MMPLLLPQENTLTQISLDHRKQKKLWQVLFKALYSSGKGGSAGKIHLIPGVNCYDITS